jgi:hypothetical protein
MWQETPFFPGDTFRFRHALNKPLELFQKNHISPNPKAKNARIPQMGQHLYILEPEGDCGDFFFL